MKKRLFFILMTVLFLSSLFACTERNEPVSVTVSFVSNGGTVVSSVTDKTIRTVPVSKREGYILDGWYEDEKLSVRVSFPYKAGSSCTLYAKWFSKEDGNEGLVFQQSKDGTEYYVIGCSSLCETIWIPDTYKSRPVTTLNAGFLTVKNRIKTLHVGKNVTAIHETFSRCILLEKFEVDSGNTSFSTMEDVLFSADRESLLAYPVAKKDATYTVPETVREIGKNALAHTSCLEELTFGKNVVSSYRVFLNIDSLKRFSVTENSLYKSKKGILYSTDGDTLFAFPCNYEGKEYTIENGTKTVSEGAFDGCLLQTLTLNESLESFPTLENAKSLEAINCTEGSNFLSKEGVLFSKDGKVLLSLPQGKTGSYSVPEGVESIGSFACNGCSVSDIVIPSSVKTIEGFAFCDASELTKIIFAKNSGIESIKDSALIRCNKLSYIAFTSRKPPETSDTLFDACAVDLILSVPENTLTLYRACWKMVSALLQGKGEAVAEYTVTFDACGGEAVESVTGTGIASAPTTSRTSENPEHEVFALLGWYDNPQGVGEKIEFPYAVEKDVTLYAAWDKIYK